MGVDNLDISLAAIRAVAEQTASVGLSEAAVDKLSRTPRSRCSSPAASLRGTCAEGLEASVDSRSTAAIGDTEDHREAVACRPPRPKSTGALRSIPEGPKPSLPNPVLIAVQQTVDFVAAAAVPSGPQRAIDTPERLNAHDRDAYTQASAYPISDTASSVGSIEFQSPPTDQKGSASKGKTMTQVRFKEIVNRLHNTAEMYQNNRQQRQLQKAQEEEEVIMKAKPTINKRSAQMARNIEPLMVRTEKRKAALEKKQENERLEKVQQEIKQLKPNPRINPKSQEICSERKGHGIHSQYRWDEERRQRLEAEQEQRKEEELKDCTFKPQLSAVSEKLSRQYNCRDVHDRLHRQAIGANRYHEAAHPAAHGGYPTDPERGYQQGTSKALSFEAFMGELPASAASTTPRSSAHSIPPLEVLEQEPTPPQAPPREPLAAPKRRQNPLLQGRGMPSLQELRRCREEAELKEQQKEQELGWEDEQEAVNRAVRHISNLHDHCWEDDQGSPEHPRMTPRYGLRRLDDEWSDPEETDVAVASARHNTSGSHHGTKAMSFESFMQGASLGHQLNRNDLPPHSPCNTPPGPPLCSTSSFVPADIPYGMGCAAELNVIKYDRKFRDIFGVITGEA